VGFQVRVSLTLEPLKPDISEEDLFDWVEAPALALSRPKHDHPLAQTLQPFRCIEKLSLVGHADEFAKLFVQWSLRHVLVPFAFQVAPYQQSCLSVVWVPNK
jgi:hypothetical protein